jgi:hypothetical protein
MNQYPYINPDLIYNSFSSENVIVLEPESVNLLELNSTAMFICSKFNGCLTIEEVNEIVKSYCNENKILHDNSSFYSFIDSLKENRFILISEVRIQEDMDINWNNYFSFDEFNPCLQIISDMSEGFFSKVFIDI